MRFTVYGLRFTVYGVFTTTETTKTTGSVQHALSRAGAGGLGEKNGAAVEGRPVRVDVLFGVL